MLTDAEWKDLTTDQQALQVIQTLWEYIEGEYAGTTAFDPGSPLHTLTVRSTHVERLLSKR